ncbi:unnamed protein product, partial [Discosporangium mesarthrocarpum]
MCTAIQLDGNVTYPNEVAGDRSDSDPPTITWEGQWHYAQKHSMQDFKYVFLGPEKDPDGGDEVRHDGKNEADRGGDGKGEPRPNGSFSGPSGEKEGNRTLTINVSLAENGTRGGDASVTGLPPGNRPVPRVPNVELYGPGGDGRLPSGWWAGEFVVKGKGRETTVTEEFYLEFGMGRSPRTSAQTPLPPDTERDGNRADDAQLDKAKGGEALGVRQRVGEGEGERVGIETEAPASATWVEPADGAEVSPSGAMEAVEAKGEGMKTGDEVVTATAGTGGESLSGSRQETDMGGAVGVGSATGPSSTTADDSGNGQAGGTRIPRERITHECMAPVVRVSGRGSNRYGEFNLTGGHERATGRLDLTRIYYVVSKKTAVGSAGASHHKKKRPLAPGAPAPVPPGPSLAERRTKRSRCLSTYQRMYNQGDSTRQSERDRDGMRGGPGGGGGGGGGQSPGEGRR